MNDPISANISRPKDSFNFIPFAQRLPVLLHWHQLQISLILARYDETC